MEIDLLADSPDNSGVPNTPALQTVSALVAEYDVVAADIKRLDYELSVRKQRKLAIEREAMPLAMETAGVSSFTTPSGRSVKIEEVVNGNIPAATTIEKARGEDRLILVRRRELAISIVKEKWPGLVKTELSLSLGKGETELASRIAEEIRKLFQLTASIDETIHPASLNSHFNELKADGRLAEIPVEPFALYIGPIAKIK